MNATGGIRLRSIDGATRQQVMAATLNRYRPSIQQKAAVRVNADQTCEKSQCSKSEELAQATHRSHTKLGHEATRLEHEHPVLLGHLDRLIVKVEEASQAARPVDDAKDDFRRLAKQLRDVARDNSLLSDSHRHAGSVLLDLKIFVH